MTEPEAGLIEQLLMVFGALAGLAMATCAAFIFGVHGYIKGRLRENPGFRQRVALELEEPKWSAPYLRGLNWGLGRLDEIMGPINFWPGALQGFRFCLALALAYSSALLIFGWGFFGASGQIGTFDALPDWNFWLRVLLASAVLVLCGVIGFYRIRWIGGLAIVAVGTAALGAETIAGAVPVGGTSGAGVVAVLAVGAVAIAGAIGAGVVAVVVIGTITGAVAGAMAPLTNVGETKLEFVMLLLWVALPIVNAGPDVISWWVSRGLGRHMQRTIGSATAYFRKLVSFVGHVFLDLVAAVFFFALLAWLMPRVVDGVNRVANWAASDLRLPLWEADGIICRTALDPWGEGAWPMMMLLSTLVPTALHFGMALLGPLVARWLKWFHAPDVAAQLRAVPPDYCGEGQGGALVSQAIDDAASKLTWAWFWAIITGAVIVAMLWVALLQIEDALPLLGSALDAGLDGFKRWMIWMAYGFDWEPVGACLGV